MTKKKRMVAFAMAGLMLFQTLSSAVPVFAMGQEADGMNLSATSGNAENTSMNVSVYEAGHFRAEFQIVADWNQGYNGTITITNTGGKTIDNWYLAFDLEDEIQNLQCGSILQHEGNRYLVKNAGWNQDIPAGGSVSFTFTAAKAADEVLFPSGYSMDTILKDIADDSYQSEFVVQSDWGTGFTSVLVITNTSEEVISDWKLKFSFAGTINSIGGGELVRAENDMYEVEAYPYDYGIQPGETRSIQIIGSRADDSVVPTAVILRTAEYYLPPEEIPEIAGRGGIPFDDTPFVEEIARMEEQNGESLPVMYLDEEDDIPCFICGMYSGVKVMDAASAIQSLQDITFIMQIDWNTDSFEEISTQVYGNQMYYRLQQYYKGMKVCGKQLIVTTDSEGNITALSGDFDPITEEDLTVQVSVEDAAITAAGEVEGTVDAGTLVWYSVEAGYDEPAWYFEGNDQCVYVSAVYGDVLEVYAAGAFSQERYPVSDTEDVLVEYHEDAQVYALVDTTRNIEVRGYCSKSVRSGLDGQFCIKDGIGLDAEIIDQLKQLIHGRSIWGIREEDFRVVYDVSYLRKGRRGDDVEDWKVKSDLYYMSYATRLYDYYLKTLGIVGYDKIGSLLRVAYDSSIERNAYADCQATYYDGPEIENITGTDSGSGLTPYNKNMGLIRVSPEYFSIENENPYRFALAHEYAHLLEGAVIGNGGLLQTGEAEVIKEGLADCMKELMECSVGENEKWECYPRDIENAEYVNGSTDSKMPVSIEENLYYELLYAHQKSTVISHTIYQLYKDGFATADQMTEWLYRTFHYLPQNCTYVQLLCALMQSAADMGLEEDKVQEAFLGAGIEVKEYEYSGNRGVVQKRIQVVDENKNPISNAELSFRIAGKRYLYYTDQKGWATISLPNTKTNISVYAGKFVYKKDGGKFVYRKDDYLFESIIPVTTISYNKAEDSGISGRAVNAINGAIVEGVTIKVRSGWNVRNGRSVKTVTSDYEGNYSIEGLSYGMYTLEYAKTGYVRQYETVIIGKEPEVMDMAMSPRTEGDEARIVLTWNEDPRDLDSHLECYQDERLRYHIYYGNRQFLDEAWLDLDDVNGCGPETITVWLDEKYDYRYYVYRYSGMGTLAYSGAKVKFIYHNEDITYSIIPEKHYGNYWQVFEFRDGKLIPGN